MNNSRFLARIRAELAKPAGRGRLSRGDIAGLLDLAERAERLEPFVQHRPECEAREVSTYAGGIRAGCTCGMFRAWTGQG